jgi:hypothetical protein
LYPVTVGGKIPRGNPYVSIFSYASEDDVANDFSLLTAAAAATALDARAKTIMTHITAAARSSRNKP